MFSRSVRGGGFFGFGAAGTEAFGHGVLPKNPATGALGAGGFFDALHEEGSVSLFGESELGKPQPAGQAFPEFAPGLRLATFPPLSVAEQGAKFVGRGVEVT